MDHTREPLMSGIWETSLLPSLSSWSPSSIPSSPTSPVMDSMRSVSRMLYKIEER